MILAKRLRTSTDLKHVPTSCSGFPTCTTVCSTDLLVASLHVWYVRVNFALSPSAAFCRVYSGDMRVASVHVVQVIHVGYTC